MGDYRDGRLGIDIAEIQKIPKVLSSLPQIKLISCGSDNTFAITENSNKINYFNSLTHVYIYIYIYIFIYLSMYLYFRFHLIF
jgi:hypothetical protein